MADRTYLFDDLLLEDHLRGKVYEISESPDGQIACVELVARRGMDWFYARRWVSLGFGRRALYRLIDRAEAAGYRFAVATHAARSPEPLRELPRQTERASVFLAELAPEERTIYRELFPQETALLEDGYDWDGQHVFRAGSALAPDAHGRLVERSEGFLWEWVRVEEEFTWRRYPLDRLPTTTDAAVTSPGPVAESA